MRLILWTLFLLTSYIRAFVTGSEDPDIFYEIITSYNDKRNATLAYSALNKVHLIRVPKAGSSSLSAISRRMVGCNPPGPCCRYPGNPKGSCPAPKEDPDQLFRCQTQNKVVGCTHHYPHIELLNPKKAGKSPINLVSMSMMREPVARALSSFSYVPPHNNRHGVCAKGYSDSCFEEYLNGPTWNNIAVKMFSGSFAYVPHMACRSGCTNSLDKALTNMDRLTFMGIMELWPISILVLYAKVPRLQPIKAEFSPYGLGDAATSGTRQNIDPEYVAFKKTARDTHGKLLQKQNALDIELYKHALLKLCRDVHALGLWEIPVVRKSWSKSVPSGYGDAAPECNSG